MPSSPNNSTEACAPTPNGQPPRLVTDSQPDQAASPRSHEPAAGPANTKSTKPYRTNCSPNPESSPAPKLEANSHSDAQADPSAASVLPNTSGDTDPAASHNGDAHPL